MDEAKRSGIAGRLRKEKQLHSTVDERETFAFSPSMDVDDDDGE